MVPWRDALLGEHLGGEKNAVAAAGDGLADNALFRAASVHLRRVDMRHAEIDAAAQGADPRRRGRRHL